ncbi:MAG: lysine--tRNA ligase [Candidatus Altiarchaeota archaeon]|nr:lysine--tRNA ligase [Candidatus Altiarchaeota archaeon]
MHWADSVADELLGRGKEHVIETGTSISGIPHVGNASDVIRGDAVRKALADKGVTSGFIWVADDSDPLRKIPKGLEAVKDYLGFPVHDIIDPFNCHKSFVEHFVEPFLSDLEAFGVKPKTYSGTELYRSGALYEEIRTALDNSEKIVAILNEFRKDPLSEDFIPWNPVCEGCGRISTAKAVGRNGDIIDYVCEDAELAGGLVKGCGFRGEADVREGRGKLPWRVEWAARWRHFKVTCEPLGKEHASAGGSYWTSRIISKEVFGWEPPLPLVYEFFTLNGEKISSSRGNVITLSDWLQICEPEVLKFFMYKRLQKQRDINLGALTNMVDEYDEAEKVYFGLTEGDEDVKRHYLLSQVNEPRMLQIPFTLCAVLAQVVPDLDLEVMEGRLRRHGYGGFDPQRLERRIRFAREWNTRYGPDYLQFTLLDDSGFRKIRGGLSEKQSAALGKLADELGREWKPEALHKRMYEISREIGLKPPEMFEAVYLVLIGRRKGPKAASFILSLDKDFIRERFTL